MPQLLGIYKHNDMNLYNSYSSVIKKIEKNTKIEFTVPSSEDTNKIQIHFKYRGEEYISILSCNHFFPNQQNIDESINSITEMFRETDSTLVKRTSRLDPQYENLLICSIVLYSKSPYIHNIEFIIAMLKVEKTLQYYMTTGIFGNYDPLSNGERTLYEKIKPHIHTIFDVGCRKDSEFIDFDKEVHYFDPVPQFIDDISRLPNKNSHSRFNKFGLGSETRNMDYYPKYQSFYDRVVSCGDSDVSNKLTLYIKRGDDYMNENKVESVDFLKIDTEGFEYEVVRGFSDRLKDVKLIQFEYGGTYLDNGVKLNDIVKYLSGFGFCNFCYVSQYGLQRITDFSDHYQYCNIVCVNSNYNEMLQLYDSL